MILLQWKQRLYAFLLRRVLDPWLDHASLQQLHETLQVSLSEGRLVLKGVGLQTQQLTDRLAALLLPAINSKIRVKQATVERLEVTLALHEKATFRTASSSSSSSSRPSPSSENVSASSAPATSFAWRAWQLGTSSSSSTSAGALALVVTVIVHGLHVELESVDDDDEDNETTDDVDGGAPKKQQQQQQQQKHDEDQAHSSTTLDASSTSSSTEGLVASYMEAALSSLRLSVTLQQARVRFSAPSSFSSSCDIRQPTITHWVELGLARLAYHDVDHDDPLAQPGANDQTQTQSTATPPASSSKKAPPPSSSYETIMRKQLDMTGLVLSTGTSGDGDDGESTLRSAPQKMAFWDGVGRLRLRAIQYSYPASTAPAHVQRDVEMTLPPWRVLCRATSLQSLGCVVQSLARARTNHANPAATTATSTTSSLEPVVAPSSQTLSAVHPLSDVMTVVTEEMTDQRDGEGKTKEEEADFRTLQGIMQQYQEARRLAERQEMRGGLLLPSDDTNQEEGVTFDAFFDANDQSFYRYSTVLSQSMHPPLTSTGQAIDQDVAPDFVHTKLRCHLAGGSIKVDFAALSPVQDDNQRLPLAHPEEYLLLTVDDVNISSTLSLQRATHACSVAHLEMEHSSVVQPPSHEDQSWGANLRRSARTEIASLLRFHENRNGCAQEDLLLSAPCISLDFTTTPSSGASSLPSTEVEIALEPLQLTFHPAVAHKLAHMISSISTIHGGDAKMAQAEQLETRCASAASSHCHISCPAMDIRLPVASAGANSDRMFHRCGVERKDDTYEWAQSYLGLHFDAPSMEIVTAGEAITSTGARETIRATCQTIVAYALSPCFGNGIMDHKLRQVDLLALGGATDLLSLSLYQSLVPSERGRQDGIATQVFPKAPPLSSFKARQGDDDDEDDMTEKADRTHASGLSVVDPQLRMIEEAASSEMVIDVQIPDILVDISTEELMALRYLLDGLSSASSESTVPLDSNKPVPHRTRRRLSAACTINSLSIALHSAPSNLSSITGGVQSFTYVVKADRFRAHALLDGNDMRHVRLLNHKIDFFEICNLDTTNFQNDAIGRDAEARSEAIRQRIHCSADSTATPILHRSSLFAPISGHSPCFLVDILDMTRRNLDGSADVDSMAQRNLHVTLYDMTHRFDYDSRWMDRFQGLMNDIRGNGDAQPRQAEENPDESMTRLFFSFADCNFDYTSSGRFKTPCRIITRVGDVRLSSNLVSPPPKVQSFRFSIGDVAVYLCNRRYPYNFENSRLLDADIVMASSECETSFDNAAAALRDMNYRTIVMLDSADAAISVAKEKLNRPADPFVRATMTIGEIGLFACKDSFHLFVGSVGEVVAEATALNDDALLKLNQKPPFASDTEAFFDSSELEDEEDEPQLYSIGSGKKNATMTPIQKGIFDPLPAKSPAFLLDGYDWTTVDQDKSPALEIPPGEEQVAKWYDEKQTPPASSQQASGYIPGRSISKGVTGSVGRDAIQFIHHHFPLHPVLDPSTDGDMGAVKYAGTSSPPPVKSRVIINDLRLKVRLFDGYDWPETLPPEERPLGGKRAFIIDETQEKLTGHKEKTPAKKEAKKLERKSAIMADLLDGAPAEKEVFQDLPLPEERGARLKEQAELQKLARRSDKYLQFSALGISLRNDSMVESDEHLLVSCLNLAVNDFFVAETISQNIPVKMVGEWFNEAEHPRDTKNGLLMMKMVTWHAGTRVKEHGEIANDECEAAVQILPLRCSLSQRANRFARLFFQSSGSNDSGNDIDDDNVNASNLPRGLHAVPPPLFRIFRFMPFKVKVDYMPEKVDSKALRDGQIVELVNLSPLDGMVLTLDQVKVHQTVGLGSVLSQAVGCWIGNICSTQLLKFLTNARPLEPLTNVGGGMVDLVVLPWEAFQNGESVKKAMRSGAHSLARAVAYEALNISSFVTQFIASQAAAGAALMGQGDGPSSIAASNSRGMATHAPFSGPLGYNTTHSMLPLRPLETPWGVQDSAPHAVESLSRGLQEANLKIVIIPYREYCRRGPSGAVHSVLRGIPVALAAPASGAAEALSFCLLGARNQLRPDIRKEEEVRQRGLRRLDHN